MNRCIAILLLLSFALVGCVAAKQEYVLPPSLYSPDDFQMEGEYLTCSAGQTILGIDVSSHQGEIDWQAVAEAGIGFAFVRLGYRGYDSGTLQEDTYARQNLQRAKAAGIPVGAYFFSQATSPEEAAEEAAYALEILGQMQLELPLVYDWEYISASARTGSVDKKTLTDCTLAFCQAVEAAGHEAMIYANTDQVTRRLDMEKLEGYPLWLAKYDLQQDFPCKADLWQYTDEGKVPGISGKVDINLMFAEYGLGAAYIAGEVE